MFHLRLKNRLCVLSGNGGGGTPSSAIIDSLVSTELARLRMLRLPIFFERGGGAERSTKSDEPTESRDIVSSRLCAMPGGLQVSCGGRCSSSEAEEEEYEARYCRLEKV